MKKRHHNRRRLRFMGLVLFLVAIAWPIFMVTWSVLEYRWSDLDYLPYSAAWLVAFGTPAVLLWITERWVSKWLVPLGSTRCPGCGYRLEHLTSEHCPECGLKVPRLFVNPPAAPRPEHHDRGQD